MNNKMYIAVVSYYYVKARGTGIVNGPFLLDLSIQSIYLSQNNIFYCDP